MLTLRRSHERGHANHGWLDTYHTFSFADYFDPQHMGFSVLRVINEDRVSAGQGFGKHGHRDMEIITVVLEGELEHEDSMGNKEKIRPGEVQRMSAGTGVQHSEYNPSPMQPVHLLQIWIETGSPGAKPGYEQKAFPADGRRGRFQLVVSPDGRDGSLSMNQDASLYLATLQAGDSLTQPLATGRKAYMHVATGSVLLGTQRLGAGDGLRIVDETELVVAADGPAEVLLFDLPQ